MLVRAAQTGDPLALDALMSRYLPWVRQTVALQLGRRLRDNADLDEIVQESLLDAFRGLQRFQDRGEGAFRFWMVTIVTNNVRDAIRRDDRTSRRFVRPRSRSGSTTATAALRGHHASPSEEAQAAELEQRIEAALLLLSESHRSVIVMRDRCGLEYGEIASRLGFKNGDTVRALHNRALRRLERAIALQA
jgi:RNA polymerase sigma-70 factor (ECF subfamily)